MTTDAEVIEALDEFLEQGINSGAFATFGGTGWNTTAEQEAIILRAHLASLRERRICS